MIEPCAEGPWRAVEGEAAAHVELTAQPVTPFWARRHARAVLGAWQVAPEPIETAVLLVSELVSNAVAVTAALAESAREPAGASGMPIVQTLRRQPGWLVIEVSDSDTSPPVLAEAGLDAEAGRGLMLVQALSKEWSYFFTSGGKTVYCVLCAES